MKLIAVSFATLVLAAFASPASSSAPQQRRTGLIAVFAITQREVVEGRLRLVVKNVRDRRSRPIGNIGQVCTRLPLNDAPLRQSCVGTLVMPLGRITYQGVRHSATYYVLAVTGGTGAYSGVSGTLAARTITTGPRVEWLLVSLV